MAAKEKRDFVIVHGAWTGGWSWQRVVDRLHAKGHRAFAPTLTGLCEKSHLLTPAVNLDTHIDDIVNEMVWKDLTGVVLVAHSYGGIVGTGVIERVPERIASVIYIEAFIPADGQSFADMAPGMTFEGLSIPPFPSEPGEYLREDDRLWSTGKASAHPTAAFTQKLKVTGAYRRVPKKTFVVATGWDAFSSTAARYRNAAGWTVHDLPSGHDMPIDMPDELTEVLIQSA